MGQEVCDISVFFYRSRRFYLGYLESIYRGSRQPNVPEQESKSLMGEGPDTEFQYVVDVRAVETFVNQMARVGIIIPDKSSRARFASPRRLDMKSLKQRGLIWSYTVIRVRYNEEVIEEG